MNKARTPLVSPTASSAGLHEIDEMFFRAHASSDDAATLLAGFAAEGTRNVDVAIVRDADNKAYCNPYRELDGTVRMDVAIPSSAPPDWSNVVERIAAEAPEVILLGLSACDSARFMQVLGQSRYLPQVFNSEWAMKTDLIQAGGRAVEGTHLTTHTFRSDFTEEYREFRRRYRIRLETERSGCFAVRPARFHALHSPRYCF